VPLGDRSAESGEGLDVAGIISYARQKRSFNVGEGGGDMVEDMHPSKCVLFRGVAMTVLQGGQN